MNSNKIAFIICYNNLILFNECCRYISRLIVPDGVTVEILSKTDAKSITSGYNEMMGKTDAKYKVYLHQDTYIINKNFIKDILDIFESDNNIGLIGMLGYERMADNGVMWNSDCRVGSVPMYGAAGAYEKFNFGEYIYSITDEGVTDVAVADGFLLATSCQEIWDEENFDGWDFYDSDYCFSLRKKGYRTVVPNQVVPWCIHDDGLTLTLWSYNRYRKIFLDKYKSINNDSVWYKVPEAVNSRIINTLVANETYEDYNVELKNKLMLCIDTLCSENDLSQISAFLELIKDPKFVISGETSRMTRLIGFYGQLGNCRNYEELLERYLISNIMLRRIEQGETDAADWLWKNGIGHEAIVKLLEEGIFEKKVYTLDMICMLYASIFMDYKEFEGALSWLNLIKNKSDDTIEIIHDLEIMLRVEN